MPSHRQRRRQPLFVGGSVLLVAFSAVPLLLKAKQDSTPRITPIGILPRGILSSSEILVDLRDDATAADIRAIEARSGLQLRPNSIEARDDKLMRATLPKGRDMQRVLSALQADSRVEAAEPDARFAEPETPELEAAPQNKQRNGAEEKGARSASLLRPHGWVPNDPRYSEQWNFRMVGAGVAWERSHGKGIVVAVLDTGIAAKTTPRGQQARDFNRTDFVAGYDFVHDDDDPYDDQGHGTHVAGTIAESTNNREGVAGLAFEAKLMPLKVLSSNGTGNSADIADAIRFAADHGANIINLSLGGPLASKMIQDAVDYARRKGLLIVCAAGNGFGAGVSYPAAFRGCLAVSSVGPTGNLAFYSSYGPQVALAAPGGDRSADPDGGVLQNTVWPPNEGGEGDDYYQFQGTSMAAPHVAAVAALVMAQGIRDPSRVRDILLRSARKQGPRDRYGAGIVSAERATAVAVRQIWAGRLKELTWTVFALPLLWQRRASRSALLCAFMTGAFWVGAFGPDWIAGYVGADSLLNLLSFSALAPFLLFWELEDRDGSRVVMALSLGVALCLTGACWGGVLSPFTATAWGWTALPWTLTNLAATLLIAGIAWARTEAGRA